MCLCTLNPSCSCVAFVAVGIYCGLPCGAPWADFVHTSLCFQHGRHVKLQGPVWESVLYVVCLNVCPVECIKYTVSNPFSMFAQTLAYVTWDFPPPPRARRHQRSFFAFIIYLHPPPLIYTSSSSWVLCSMADQRPSPSAPWLQQHLEHAIHHLPTAHLPGSLDICVCVCLCLRFGDGDGNETWERTSTTHCCLYVGMLDLANACNLPELPKHGLTWVCRCKCKKKTQKHLSVLPLCNYFDSSRV